MSNQFIAEPLIVLERTVTALEKFSLPYVVGGSFASGARSQFRSTNDIDIVCKFSLTSLKLLLNELKSEFYLDEQSAIEALTIGSSFNIIHNATIIKVDFFTKIGPFEELQINRATSLAVTGLKIQPKFATAEDVILAKLRWYRIGGEQSERQWNDLSLVMNFNQASLDFAYMKQQATNLGVEDLLAKLTDH